MQKLNVIFLFLYCVVQSSSIISMNMDLISVEENLQQHKQKFFSGLVGSHDFSAAKAYAEKNPCVLSNSRDTCLLHEAVKRDDCSSAEFLVACGMKYKEVDYLSVSSKKMARLLMEHGVTDEDKNKLNTCLLQKTIGKYGNAPLNLIDYLALQICDINMCIDDQKSRFLHQVVHNENAKGTEILLARNANPEEQNRSGQTPFDCAIQTGKVELITPFNKAGMFFVPTVYGNPFNAILDTIRLFAGLSDRADDCAAYTAEKFITQLFITIKQRKNNKVRQVFRDRIVLNDKGLYFYDVSFKDLNSFVGRDQIQRIKGYLRRKCELMMYAVQRKGNHSTVDGIRNIDDNYMCKLLRSNSLVLSYNQRMAFHILLHALYACNNRAFKYSVSTLVPNLSGVDEDGNTLLHYAAAKNDKDAVECLIKNGIDCFKRNNKEQTAFDVAKVLIDAESFMEMLGAFGDKCISLVQCNKQQESVAKKEIKNFFKAGYDVNLLTYHGEPLLCAAVSWCSPVLCSALLKAGASVDVKNSLGCTPLMLAMKENDIRTLQFNIIVPLLLEHNALITEDMLNSELQNDDIRAMLLRVSNMQKCCA